jgi:acyl-CoA synthetase (AMP-forming)/AMP-acid ligase II
MTLPELLQAVPADRTAIVLPDANVSVTYGALRQQIEAVANDLAAFGVTRNDRVGIALGNGLPTIVSFLAASIAGTAAPLNPAYREEEFRFYLDDTNARVLILPPDDAEEARRAAGDKVPILTAEMDASGTVRLNGSNRQAGRTAAAPQADDVALILHTSGSTGRPKRVPLSHRNLTVSTRNVAATYALGPSDVSLCVMPLFHVHGLVASTLATLATGGTLVVPPKFNALSFWRTVRDHKVTWYSAVPTMHQMLLGRASKGGAKPEGAENLRFIRSCSAPLVPQTMQDLEAAFGAPVLEAYGMTEAAHQMASNPLPPGPRKPGSVGPGTGVRISIMDEEGRHLAPNQRGEVVIQGPNVITGYENNPEANAKSFTDGWFRTGDQGYIDDNGYLCLVGRLKELINRGGEKISPVEIDQVLLSHPSVAEAVSFAVPHKSWGEEVAAAVVLSAPASEADLLAHCRARLADFKCPKEIHITEAIPRTATGKIQRRVVADVYGPKAQ